MIVEFIFWLSFAVVVYAHVGYPVALVALNAILRRDKPAPHLDPKALPRLSLLVPVHNEANNIDAKLRNTAALQYPEGKLEVLYISDGSTDSTVEKISAQLDRRSRVITIQTRGGKAGALNAGLGATTHEVVVFTDASIMLAPDALLSIVQPFADATVGCVSGEDRIGSSSGEGVYGRYELMIRRLESRLFSIVGASGSFYAQRRTLCDPFTAGFAPDFLSVLRTVEKGSRAVSEPAAAGTMTAIDRHRDEFERKVRTILRGITTLSAYARLLNPFRYGWFAFELGSHKLARWSVPLWLALMFVANAVLATDSIGYATILAGQVAFYGLAILALTAPGSVGQSLPGRICLYFAIANVATLAAWVKFAGGVRQEIWSPSQRVV